MAETGFFAFSYYFLSLGLHDHGLLMFWLLASPLSSSLLLLSTFKLSHVSLYIGFSFFLKIPTCSPVQTISCLSTFPTIPINTCKSSFHHRHWCAIITFHCGISFFWYHLQSCCWYHPSFEIIASVSVRVCVYVGEC